MDDVVVDLRPATPFQRAVYDQTRLLPPGKTATYGEVAAAIGRPAAPRAVGAALGKNPVALVVPCHRVLGADGRMVGFSAADGTALKERLLAIEGALDPAAWLSRRDRALERVVERVGPCRMPVGHEPPLEALGKAIVYQQLTGKVAVTLWGRAKAVLGTVTPDRLAAATVEELRGAGLSRAKATALNDLGRKAGDGTLDLDALPNLDDDAVRAALVRVRGIGRWTADMFLAFRLGRRDVLPVGDYGVRKAVRDLYGLPDLPDPAELTRIAEPWRPHRTAASWYLWRTLDVALPSA
jgi:methylated-DNA-[protein]-cysteine S-methyltransferase